MNDEPRLSSARISRTLAALAHPARRAMLGRLLEGELRVTELAKPFAMSLNSVSKHVRVLERARLVRRRRAGREHFLTFDPGPLSEVVAWIASHGDIWASRADAVDALLEGSP